VGNDQNSDAKTADRRLVTVEIHSKRYGSNRKPSVQVIKVPMVDNNTVRLDITVDLRQTDTIEIRPIRRDLDDVDGLIEDAQRLAHESNS
jgi:hypothetical protein